MKRVLVNGLSAKSAGGLSIYVNLIKALSKYDLEQEYIILGSELYDQNVRENKNIKFLTPKRSLRNKLSIPFSYSFSIPNLLRKHKIDLVLNLADIPIRTKIRQVFLFDWPYAVYPESVVWQMMSVSEKLERNIKLFLFKQNAKYINLLLAQSDVMKSRLECIYGFNNVKLAPNAVSLDHMDEDIESKYNFPAKKRFLYLTSYYPHKNLDIFIPLAILIKERNLPYVIITTIESRQGPGAKKFLNTINDLKLDDVIMNIGRVDMKDVPGLYGSCNALLMPTLLESFSGTYVEAMFHEIPILTSDLDFAKTICGNGAVYFEPFDPKSILDSMILLDDKEYSNKLTNVAKAKLDQMPKWEESAKLIINEITNLLN